MIAPFETIGAAGGRLPLWPRHLLRLEAAARRLDLPWAPPADLRRQAEQELAAAGLSDGVLKLVLRGGAFAFLVRPRDDRATVRLLPCVARRPATAPPADLKAEPRAYYDAVRAEAVAGGADDGIVLGADGAVLETASGNLWLRLGASWVTPPLDGRLLPGIARAVLLEGLQQKRVAVEERPLFLSDLHAASALVVSNAVHGPRPAGLVGAAVAPLDPELLRVWQRALVD